jgi:multidrug efflux pump subunit AcrB
VASTVRSLISGQVATRYREGDYFYNIRVMIPEQHFTSKQEVENLVLSCAQGGYLRLKDVARVIREEPVLCSLKMACFPVHRTGKHEFMTQDSILPCRYLK